MGVWIEILSVVALDLKTYVTPFVGVWIEIPELAKALYTNESLPSWECGLKYIIQERIKVKYSHSLRGSVD